MVQAHLIKRGLLLEYVTLGWNVVGVIIVVTAAYMARSVALAGFGLDSLIEIFASKIAKNWLCGLLELHFLPLLSTFWHRLV